jgi:uncharacterized protein (TIGR02145 family)
VSWTGTPYNNRVWVWVDFCPVAGASPGTFEKAVISRATATAGGILTVAGNTRGFYVTANGATVTATLSNATGKFNWCAYGSDYPPNVTANGGIYTLRGTPPFTLIAASGTPTQKVSGSTITTSAVTITPITLTDETGYPGDFCIYTGSDLLIDATHLCQQRTSGAKNWEAYIRDARDSKIYRIVQMPDGKWYFAQDLDYRNGSNHMYNASYCSTYIYGVTAANSGIVCPSGWDVPTSAIWTQLITSINGAQSCWADFWPTTAGGNDNYGFTAIGNCASIAVSGGMIYKLTDSGSYAYRAYWAKTGNCAQQIFNKRDARCHRECITESAWAYTAIRCVHQL